MNEQIKKHGMTATVSTIISLAIGITALLTTYNKISSKIDSIDTLKTVVTENKQEQTKINEKIIDHMEKQDAKLDEMTKILYKIVGKLNQ